MFGEYLMSRFQAFSLADPLGKALRSFKEEESLQRISPFVFID